MLCVCMACWINSITFQDDSYFHDINIQNKAFSYGSSKNVWWPDFSLLVGAFTGVLCVLVQKGVMFIKRRTSGRDHGEFLVKCSK